MAKIKSYKQCRRPDVVPNERFGLMKSTADKLKQVEVKERMLANKAKGLGLQMSIAPGGMYRFRRDNGLECKVYGLWAAREFIRGAEFAYATNVETYEAEGWRDPEVWPKDGKIF